LVGAFARSIMQELDFRIEAENARRLASVLEGAPEVRVPRVYPALSSERVLVMEYVEGARVGELAQPARVRARHALVRAFVRQILEHGVFHADPHPGNLLVLADGRLVLLDLGTVDQLDGPLRASLFRLVLALLLRRHAALCDEVLRLGQSSGHGVDRTRLEADVASLLRATGSGAGAGMVGHALSMSRVHRLRLPPALLALMRALAMLDGVLRGLEPAADIIKDVRREMGWALLRTCGRKLRAPWRRLAELAATQVRRVFGGPRGA
jgi:ubiquinone biosynthesis protein